MKKNGFSYLVLIAIIFQGCAVYQETSISLDQALNQGKVKVINNSGEEFKFMKIIQEDSIYYGYNSKKRKNDDGIYEWVNTMQPLFDHQLEAIFLKGVVKNVVYTSLSGYMMSGSAFSINYDRRLAKHIWATIGLGGYPVLGNGKKIDCKLTTLTGKKNSHLELALGITIGRSAPRDQKYASAYNVTIPAAPAAYYSYLAFTFGYRYQNPQGGIVFRAGIGLYEANIGLGYSF